MTIYAVGDIQGCAVELERLLERLAFSADDQLWAVGDLVNRGPGSLAVLRRLYDLRAQVRVVLGNHDFHLLAMYFGEHPHRRGDTLEAVLGAADAPQLLAWLREQPLLVRDAAAGYVMTHAGVAHLFSIAEAEALAAEVQAELCHGDYRGFLRALYGNRPDRWSHDLRGFDRLRLITNYFTRMRLIAPDGQLYFKHKGPAAAAPVPFRPWYELREPGSETLLFGHWAALEPIQGRDDVVNLDTGCVWGRALTAMNLTTRELISVPAAG
ncbi:MAG: symmetrical bis(5'-nucleosyl)-tetraphosphatase [Pseudomonadota bacterium]